jgi:hypothetical protein
MIIEFQALDNGILNGLFELSENKNSWIADDQYGLLLIDDVFTGQITTGTSNVIEDLGITVYPNPASSIVTFDLGTLKAQDYSIELYDVRGRLQFSTHNNNVLNVSNYSPGLYLYKFTTDDQSQIGKIIVR